jgi:CheY-like chemotaxis protein
MDRSLVWIVPTAIVVAVLLLVWWQFVREKRFQNGLYVWQRWSLYERGAVATGEVMNVVEEGTISGGGASHMSAILADLVVDVRPERGAPWRVSMRYLLSSAERDAVSCGATVPLRYDAANPKKIVIDWPALRRQDARGADPSKAAALAERRALLAKAPEERRPPATEATEATGAAPATGWQRGSETPKVLIFEHDAAFVNELRRELAKLGCAVTVVEDGDVGLVQAASDRPDLILLSIELPKTNGYSVCNKLKKDPRFTHVPLVILSTESTDETFEQHKKLRTRADDYVHKPIAFGALLPHLKPFLPTQGESVNGSREEHLE